ncbi:MAG: family 16 glycosylhydrolase [Bacteroidota bacterium]|nr:family 16 glycosylhydrolase [Bacteroidota bacterium]MDE2955756.1 family 16 glycosylhydrolase [Bacteroidota bacterium]
MTALKSLKNIPDSSPTAGALNKTYGRVRSLLFFTGCGLAAMLVLAVPDKSAAQAWQLVWQDEFDYVGLPDSARWNYDVGGHGWGNAELQYYTANRLENARVDGDHLIIEARKEAVFAGRDYTSARLVSRNKGDWTYGRIAVRARLPKGRGTWPAIWMLPTEGHYGNGSWPDNGEIDIMEHVGHQPNRVHSTVHNKRYNHLSGSGRGGSRLVPDATEAFHVYMVEWTPRRLDFFIDNDRIFTYYNDTQGWRTWPYDKPFHLLMNIAIGGAWGGQQGVDDSIFPQQMLIDYVRVYQYRHLPQISFEAPATLEAGADLHITATASDPDGPVGRVVFMQGGGKLATVSDAPYEITIPNAQAGCYELSATAVDGEGWSFTEGPQSLQVGDSCGRAPYLIAPHAIPGIIESENYDLGGAGVAYVDLTPQNSGGGYRLDEGVDVDYSTDRDGFDVAGISRREWLEYTVDVEEDGEYAMEARVYVPGTRAVFRLEFDGVDKTGRISYANPAALWVSVRRTGIHLTKGIQRMRMVMESTGFRVNWLSFRRISTTSAELPETLEPAALQVGYPNPFTDTTQLTYSVARSGHVTLEVVDVLGRRVATLANHHHEPGQYSVSFDADGLAAGVYWSQLTAGQFRAVQPITLVRR